MNDYLTIKEVAQITNKSYQNISQRAKTSLNKYLIEKDGRKYLKKEVLSEFDIPLNEEVIKEEIKSGIEADLNDNLNTDFIPLHHSENEDLRKEIEKLRAELKQKDEQIQKQVEKIIELSDRILDIAENTQKLQLQTSFLLSGNNENNEQADLYGARASDDIIETEPKRKGLFKRLFK